MVDDVLYLYPSKVEARLKGPKELVDVDRLIYTVKPVNKGH